MRRNAGVTLMELVVTTLLLGLLFTATFRMDQARRKVLQTAKENTLALYLLEGRRNYALSLENQDGAALFEKLRTETKTLRLPWNAVLEIGLKNVKRGDPSEPVMTPGSIISIQFAVPQRGDQGEHRYSRQLEVRP